VSYVTDDIIAGMVRTTVMADQVVMDRLKALAKQRGVSLATVVREALEDKAQEYRPRQTWIGMFDSGAPSDIAGTLAIERVPVEDR
jgi:hypothetical protein